jgi:colicin import membrane protein
MRSAARAGMALALVAAGAGAVSTPEPARDGTAAPWQRIAEARSAAEARFHERQRECTARFVVTSCIDDAKRERREALARARRDQNQLDDDMRKARATARREAANERAAAEAQRKREVVVRPARQAARKAPMTPAEAARVEKPAALESGSPRDPRPRSLTFRTPTSIERKPLETRERASFEAAQRAAESHRAEVEKRNARHAATRKPAAGLPVPSEGAR